jgi:hypothetical protein
MANAKKPQVKVVKNDDKLTVDERISIKELEEKIVSMKEDKEKKCKSAKEQLVSMLEVTVDKYRTATGTAEALRVLRFVVGGEATTDPIDLTYPNRLAWDMAGIANDMKEKAEKLSYAEMDQLCDGFYDKEFKVSPQADDDADSFMQLAKEMMCIDLCRNVGGAAEDMVEFIKRVQEEIDATGEELKKLKAKEA